ncbi:hypothetical protein [Thermococcus sp. LS1]|nr:hypothetical protein [Thermococcus sp. LS1]
MNINLPISTPFFEINTKKLKRFVIHRLVPVLLVVAVIAFLAGAGIT